ncbi:MAG: efflux RND transporter periplasmic adaptor subunit [Rhodothalassiaceae bacterium]
MRKGILIAGLLVALGGLAGHFVASLVADRSGQESTGERKILYWQSPMDPSYRSDKPGKSPMGMDLIPVYADEADDSPTDSLRIDPAVVNNIGVRTAAVERGTLSRRIDTVGYVALDDDRVTDIDVRIEGWIEDLQAQSEGEAVREGDLLFRIYARPLVSAQAEYLQALRNGQNTVIAAAGERLIALGMSKAQIAELRRSGKVSERIDVTAPQDGIVVSLNIREGAYVKPGMPVMRLADLATIWVQVDVYEDQIGWIEEGERARMRLAFAPGEEWEGRVAYVYPTIRAQSRTGRIRLAFANPGLRLKPGMYASVTIEAAPRTEVLHIPREALIRTGRAERVILALGEGRFRPAEVRSGIESGDRVEILAGLAEGERVVTSSQFLIDSEASLDASFLRMLGTETAKEARHD